MRCNPVRWLWGLLPVALLSWGAVQMTHADIEADLKARVDQQLKGSGFSWSRTGFSGRDGLLTGTATDEADPGRAYDIARSLWGVRVVENKSAVIDKVDTYEWSVVRTGNSVKLGGFVPNETVRADILKLAKSSFGGADVVDEMKLARGVPAPDT
jgi:OmpA-OmpF porin, OOP family